tara:strand:+ start:4437 stop:4700 length:264 start_codon:yes stop_codon:yes gene_type:complete
MDKKEADKQYQKEYYEKNMKSEAKKKYQKEYYEKNKMKILAYMRMYYDKKIAEEGRTHKRQYIPKAERDSATIRFYRYDAPRTIHFD